MPWADDVAAVLQCWFAGEEWGNALADVLSGDVSPSGKLPTTIPMRIEDTPAFTNYPGEDGKVHYGEGVFVGYRWYDARADRAALLLRSRPLVHDVRHRRSRLDARRTAPGRCSSRSPVTNTGAARGAEVVQCYVADVDVERRPAAAGAEGVRQGVARSRRVDDGRAAARRARVRVLGRRPRTTGRSKPGEFELRIGTSSRDIRRHVTIALDVTASMTARPTLTVGLPNFGAFFAPGSGTASSTSRARPRTPASTASSSSTTS